MTKVRKDRVVAGIKLFISEHKEGIDLLAKKAGIGTKVINKMLNMEWDNMRNEWWDAIEAEVCKSEISGIYQTNDCKTIMRVCDYAQKNAMMIGLTGDTGMGKTYVLKAVAQRQDVIYVQLNNTISVKTFLEGLLQDLNTPFNGSKSEMLNTVANRLNREANKLLIVDEASKMNDALMQTIHALRDKTMGYCGIVLAGMPHFKNRLIAGMNNGKAGYSEFYRRVNMWDELKGLQKEEINMVLADNDITGEEMVREFRSDRYSMRFGDLLNSIFNYKLLSEQA
ncbi:MAG: ATP-binding protein [Flavipsychrobacter sp.]|nr:ATP-binding protein [Flavipsychrobacter sp.]